MKVQTKITKKKRDQKVLNSNHSVEEIIQQAQSIDPKKRALALCCTNKTKGRRKLNNTQVNEEQVSTNWAGKTNQTWLREKLNKGRGSRLTHDGTGFQNKTGSYGTINRR